MNNKELKRKLKNKNLQIESQIELLDEYRNTIKSLEGEVLRLQNELRKLNQPAVIPSCRGNCGMNYCDDNGCIEYKIVLVEPKDFPKHGE